MVQDLGQRRDARIGERRQDRQFAGARDRRRLGQVASGETMRYVFLQMNSMDSTRLRR
jgi:hypothetical protein